MTDEHQIPGDELDGIYPKLHIGMAGDDVCWICGIKNWRFVKKGICDKCAKEFPTRQEIDADGMLL